MRRPAVLISIVLFGLLAAAGGASAQPLAVNIDQAESLQVSRAVKNVVVGNPMIADVIVLDPHHLLITGKSYGVTNLLVTDASGRAVISRSLVVGAPDQGRVSVYRGPDVYNYACNAKCERTPMPGERDQGVYTPWSAPYNEYAGRARAAEQSASQNSAP